MGGKLFNRDPIDREHYLDIEADIRGYHDLIRRSKIQISSLDPFGQFLEINSRSNTVRISLLTA
jgi:hypothetical protein